jgi:PAS domain S-box-containing protein
MTPEYALQASSGEDEQSLEEALRELHYQKKALDEHAIVSVSDANQKIAYANEKFCEISQFTLDELRGGHFCIGIGDEHSDEFFEDMLSTISNGTIWHGLLCNHKKDESVYWTDTTIVPFCDDTDKPYKYVVIRTDISKQKEIEAEIRARKSEVEDAHSELEAAQSDLVHAEKLASIGRLAAGVAHEINTPTQFVGDNTRFLKEAFHDLVQLLSAYQKVVDAAKEGTVAEELYTRALALNEEVDLPYLSEEIPTAIDQALEGIKRVSDIVRSMKDFSHPGSEGKVNLDINRAIESTATVSKNEWKYCATLVTEFDENLPEVPGLPGEFNQVILNILVNAAHAIEAKNGKDIAELGTITVCTSCDDDYAEIRISDTGSGITEDVRAKVFEPFFTTKEVGKGTGQGLAVARSVIVDKHGGTIRVESEIGKGSTFVIRLPLKEPESNPDRAANDESIAS